MVQILFDYNNYTDIILTNPTVNVSNCVSSFGVATAITGTIAFANFNNTYLFNDQHSYLFNNTPITISKTNILGGF